MKLERLQEYVMVAIVSAVGVGLAVYCGQQSGSGQTVMPLIIMGGVVAMLIALWMRARIWILIPLCWGMVGKTVGVPVRDASVMYVFCTCLVFRALKVVRAKHTYHWLDVLLWINIIYVGIAYIKNPVGVDAFGSEMIAGRPYLEIIFGIFAYWVLGYVTITADLARKLPWLSSIGGLFAGFLSFITSTFPSTTPLLSKIYTGIDASAYNAGGNSDAETQRAQYLAPVGRDILKPLCAYFPPISLFNPSNFRRFFLVVAAFIFALKSGHRTAIIDLFVIIVLCSYFQTGFRDLFKISAVLIPSLVCVVLLNGTLFNLPVPIQRALAFLPGNWDHRAVDDAQGSSEWRFEMWRNVWNSDKYIHSRWFGDGFGITKRQLDEGQRVQDHGLEADAGRENLTIVGDYHSGPLQCVKFTGYVGFVLYIILMLGQVVYASRLISRAKNTPFFPMALFFGAPLIWDPVEFILIFGDYKDAIPQALFKVAMLSLTDRSLTAWREQVHTQENNSKQASQQNPFSPANMGYLPRKIGV